MKQTRWRPDTCGCELSYEWDETLPEGSRPISGYAVHSNCPAHPGITDPAVLLSTLLDENRRKNIIYGEAVERLTRLTDPATTEDGTPIRVFKNGVTLTWHWDVSRALHIVITGINSSERTTLQTLADTRFGVGKVVIE